MGKTKKVLSSLLILALMLTLVNLGSERASLASGGQVNWGSETNIDPDKEWRIEFNMELDKSFVNSRYFYVQDKNGKNHPTRVYSNLGDEKIVNLKALEDYKSGQSYKLYVREGIKSKDGNNLNKSVVMDFKIKEIISVEISQTKGPNGTTKAELSISLRDDKGQPVTGLRADDFRFKIRELPIEVNSFNNPDYFTNFKEKEKKKGVYTVELVNDTDYYEYDKIYEFSSFNLKKSGMTEYFLVTNPKKITVETPKNIAEFTSFSFSSDYAIREMPKVLEGIINSDANRTMEKARIQIRYKDYQNNLHNLDEKGNWVERDEWMSIDVDDEFKNFTLTLNDYQLDAIYETNKVSGASEKEFYIIFEGVYSGNMRIENEIASFRLH